MVDDAPTTRGKVALWATGFTEAVKHVRSGCGA